MFNPNALRMNRAIVVDVPSVNPSRHYNSELRATRAAETRQLILNAAWALFTTRGYVATTVSQIASVAGVSVDTLYAAVGRKPVILREVVEAAISGKGVTIPAAERDYVINVRAATFAAEKVKIYAEAIASMSPRTAPIFRALRDAASTDEGCAALEKEIRVRRAANMLLFAADLRVPGETRDDITDQYIADVVFVTAGAEHYAQYVEQRAWTAGQFGDYLNELWQKLFLR